jgi:hypothetical protein
MGTLCKGEGISRSFCAEDSSNLAPLRKKVLGLQPIAFRPRLFQALRSRLRRRTNAANTSPVNTAK